MQTIEKRKELVDKLSILHKRDIIGCRRVYQKELIEKGKMLESEVDSIFVNGFPKITNPVYLILMTNALNQSGYLSGDRQIDLSEYFAPDRINEVLNKSSLPTVNDISFPILAKLRPNEFLTALSISSIQKLKEWHIIRWEPGMQRETVEYLVGDSLKISHIKFSTDRAKEIGSLIAANNFHPSTLRWHIVDNGFNEYIINEKRHEVVLRKGTVAEIDGQHRDRGIEFAVMENPQLDICFPIILSVGTIQDAQNIIAQDEKRVPIITTETISLSETHSRTVALRCKTIMSSYAAKKSNCNFKICEDFLDGYEIKRGILKKEVDEKLFNVGFLIEYSTFVTTIKEVFYPDDFYKQYTNVGSKVKDVAERIAQFLIIYLENLLQYLRNNCYQDKSYNETIYTKDYRYALHPNSIQFYLSLMYQFYFEGIDVSADTIKQSFEFTNFSSRDILSIQTCKQTVQAIIANLKF